MRFEAIKFQSYRADVYISRSFVQSWVPFDASIEVHRQAIDRCEVVRHEEWKPNLHISNSKGGIE